MGSEGSRVCMAGTLTTRPLEVHSAKSDTVNPKIQIFFFFLRIVFTEMRN